MSVLIIKKNKKLMYDVEETLQKQVRGAQQVIICYEDDNRVAEHFMDEIESAWSKGTVLNLDIRVVNGMAVNAAKRANKMDESLALNDIINTMLQIHANTDKMLEELSDYCSDKKK